MTYQPTNSIFLSHKISQQYFQPWLISQISPNEQGNDPRDAEATRMASQYIPEGGYMQFLTIDGLRGKRLGILRKDFFRFPSGSVQEQVFSDHFKIMRYFAATSRSSKLLFSGTMLLIQPVKKWFFYIPVLAMMVFFKRILMHLKYPLWSSERNSRSQGCIQFRVPIRKTTALRLGQPSFGDNFFSILSINNVWVKVS